MVMPATRPISAVSLAHPLPPSSASQLQPRLLRTLLGRPPTLTLTINTLVVISAGLFCCIGGESISRGLGRGCRQLEERWCWARLSAPSAANFAGQVAAGLDPSAHAQYCGLRPAGHPPTACSSAVAIGFTTLNSYARRLHDRS